MSIPPTAAAFKQPIDPKDWVDFYIYLLQGSPLNGDRPAFLLLGEGVASYSLSLSPEAVAAGLEIRQDGAYAPSLNGNELALWMRVVDDLQDDERFDENGVTVGIRVMVTTTNNPPRRKKRTALAKVVNL